MTGIKALVKPELLKLLTDAEVKAAEAKGLGVVKPKEGTPLPDGAAKAPPKGFEKVQVGKLSFPARRVLPAGATQGFRAAARLPTAARCRRRADVSQYGVSHP